MKKEAEKYKSQSQSQRSDTTGYHNVNPDRRGLSCHTYQSAGVAGYQQLLVTSEHSVLAALEHVGFEDFAGLVGITGIVPLWRRNLGLKIARREHELLVSPLEIVSCQALFIVQTKVPRRQ